VKTYYTYYSYEPWGRGYIGKRGCQCLPEEDIKYFGSFSDPSFHPSEKVILSIHDNEEEATETEVLLHDFFEVDINPQFANKARQTSSKFFCDLTGTTNPGSAIKRTELNKTNNPMTDPLVREKLKVKRNNNPEWNENVARSRQTLESREKSREAAKKQWEVPGAKQALSERRMGAGNPCYGLHWWVSPLGETSYQSECPGDNWQQGRVYKHEETS